MKKNLRKEHFDRRKFADFHNSEAKLNNSLHFFSAKGFFLFDFVDQNVFHSTKILPQCSQKHLCTHSRRYILLPKKPRATMSFNNSILPPFILKVESCVKLDRTKSMKQ